MGGSSQLNYLLHFDGNKKDLHRWKALGVELWNIDEDLPHEKYTQNDCAEDTCAMSDQNTPEQTHSSLLETYLPISPIEYDYSSLSSKFINGSIELQRKNSPNLEYYLAKYNTRKGLRYSVYQAYLKPVLSRPNLKIVLRTRVHRVLFTQKTAVAVLASEDDFIRAPQKIIAAKEVILAAGAFHTPQILKLSGVGPMKELNRFQINLVHNSPMVGRNLYDHMSMPIYVSVDEKMTVTRDNVLNAWEILNYLVRGSGIFSNFGVIGYLNDPDNNHETGIFGVGTIDEMLLGTIVNYDKEVCCFYFIF